MFCERCKKDLPDFPQICPHCGARTSLYGIDISTIEGVRAIAPHSYKEGFDMLNQIYYILQRKATVYKREKKIDLAIECLRKSNEISDTFETPPLLQKDYMRLATFLKSDKRFDEAEQVERELIHNHPEFEDKRVSNLKRIKEYLSKAKAYNTDIVYITTNSTCPFCKYVNNKKFSISGKSRKYPKLPKELAEQGGFCNECVVGISLDFKDFLNEKANRNAANGSTDTLSTQFDRLLDHYEIKHEDTPAFTRIHIYDSENRKIGLVKITKPDNKMTFKVPGNAAVYELAAPEDINKYL